jgi:hypothetical protein
MLTTTATSSKQPVGQTTRAAEPTTMTANMNEPATGKDAGNMVTMEATEQETPRQVVPEQSFAGTPTKEQVPETSQSVPEQTTTTTSSTQGGLPDATARGKAAATSSTTG